MRVCFKGGKKMKNKLIKRTLVFGTIVLFFTMSVVSAVNIEVESIKMNDNIKKIQSGYKYV